MNITCPYCETILLNESKGAQDYWHYQCNCLRSKCPKFKSYRLKLYFDRKHMYFEELALLDAGIYICSEFSYSHFEGLSFTNLDGSNEFEFLSKTYIPLIYDGKSLEEIERIIQTLIVLS